MRVPIRIANAEHRDRFEDIEDALIDTGASWTTIPKSLAERLELPSLGPATGRTAAGVQTFEQSYAYVEMEGKHGVTPLLVSELVDMVLVGVLTLESLALAVDPLNQKLTETELLLL